jgi:hypothetical protein
MFLGLRFQIRTPWSILTFAVVPAVNVVVRIIGKRILTIHALTAGVSNKHGVNRIRPEGITLRVRCEEVFDVHG